MSDLVSKKLSALRRDYRREVGRPFEHFFCPILHRDEPAKLCRGHVINQAFRNSARAWTVQREDVDSFFGTLFESEFVILQERGNHKLVDVFADPALAKKLHPEVRLDGRQVEFYRAGKDVPETHTEFILQKEDGEAVRLALKRSPSETLAAHGGAWDVGFERDLRLPGLVSLLKAAHLTMFVMLGYSWGLSSAGRFVGHDMLGRFFDANRSRRRRDVVTHAGHHFRQFMNLVRPVNSDLGGLRGTVSDQHLYLCTSSEGPWAFMVVIRTGADFHGVLLPVFEDAEGSARYLRFLNDPPACIRARLAKFAHDHWEVSTREHTLHWPPSNWT